MTDLHQLDQMQSTLSSDDPDSGQVQSHTKWIARLDPSKDQGLLETLPQEVLNLCFSHFSNKNPHVRAAVLGLARTIVERSGCPAECKIALECHLEALEPDHSRDKVWLECVGILELFAEILRQTSPKRTVRSLQMFEQALVPVLDLASTLPDDLSQVEQLAIEMRLMTWVTQIALQAQMACSDSCTTTLVSWLSTTAFYFLRDLHLSVLSFRQQFPQFYSSNLTTLHNPLLDEPEISEQWDRFKALLRSLPILRDASHWLQADGAALETNDGIESSGVLVLAAVLASNTPTEALELPQNTTPWKLVRLCAKDPDSALGIELSLFWIQFLLRQPVARMDEVELDVCIEYMIRIAAAWNGPSLRFVAITLVSETILHKLSPSAQFVTIKDLCEHDNPAMQAEAYRILRDLLTCGHIDEVGRRRLIQEAALPSLSFDPSSTTLEEFVQARENLVAQQISFCFFVSQKWPGVLSSEALKTRFVVPLGESLKVWKGTSSAQEDVGIALMLDLIQGNLDRL